MKHPLLVSAAAFALVGGLSAQQGLIPLPASADVALQASTLTPAAPAAIPSARATTGCDDFNRTTGLGQDWLPTAGAPLIVADGYASPGVIGNAQYVPASVNYDAAVVTIDLPDNPQVFRYGAVMIGLGGADNLYVKLQANGPGLGVYDTIGFYTGQGVNTSATTGFGGFFGLVTPVTGGTMTISTDTTGDLLQVDLDVDRDGIPEQSFAAPNSTLTGNGSLLTSFPPGTFGDGIGVGSVGDGVTPDLDDFELNGGCNTQPTGPQVAVASGAPGGPMSFDFTGFEPGGRIAVAYGLAGSLAIPSGPCAGQALSLTPLNYPPITSLLVLVADASGAATVSQNVGAAAAGLILVQAADVDNASGCTVSNALAL